MILKSGIQVSGSSCPLPAALGIYAAVGGPQLMARGRDNIAVFDAAITAYPVAGLIP